MTTFDPNLHVRTLAELDAATLLFSRQSDCEDCSDNRPTCQPCPAGEGCSFTITSCDACAKAICVKDDSPTEESGGSSSGPNTGAIAGGVIGGIAVIAIVTYLVWRFCIKTKRQAAAQESYEEESDRRANGEKDADARRDNRSSVHTVHSIASTVLTRASNIIQIAYIPGVTNRAAPSSPGVLVPPVPPIPMHASSNPNSPNYEDQHFFVPGDLRDSTYSGLSASSDRLSYARTSYAPRSSIAPSIASTIYGKNAVVVAPAQTGMRAKAAMVSVKSMNGGQPGDAAPPVPSIDYHKFDAEKPRDSTFSVGSTFLNNASTATATQARAQVVRVGSANQIKQVSVGSKNSAPGSPSPTSSLASTMNDSNDVTIVEEGLGPASRQSPFSDPPAPGANGSTATLSAVIEEATRRAARGPDRRSRTLSGPERGPSPFGDEHATKD